MTMTSNGGVTLNLSPTSFQVARMNRLQLHLEWTRVENRPPDEPPSMQEAAKLERPLPDGSKLALSIAFGPEVRERAQALQLWEDILDAAERDLRRRGYLRTNGLLQFFTYSHLRDDLAEVSKIYTEQAQELEKVLPDNAEKTVALRKLLESKDCAVRALLYRQPEEQT